MQPDYQKRLDCISTLLREIRFSYGKKQSDFTEYEVSRRLIQRGEHGCNLSLVTLFKILDVYGYRLDEFFEGIE